ncbi:MAG: DUF7521 family protein [Halobacteriota archaeon]
MSPHEIVPAFETVWLVSFVKTVILLIGGFVTVTAYRAYRRTSDRALLFLAIGFGLVTLGTFLAGAVYHLGLTLAEGILIESLLVLLGFAIIAYSLYYRPRV